MSECEECQVPILDGSREDYFRLRYAIDDKETWSLASSRIGNAIAMTEDANFRQTWADKFSAIIRNFYFIPGGRIIRNAGLAQGMLINCFVLGVDDNRQSIGQLFHDVFVVSTTGGGIGTNYSDLRPKGDEIKGKGGHSSGPVSFMKVDDEICSTVEIGGQRRAARIGILSCEHPDIELFINTKVKEGELSHFNVSVGITNDFIKAVKKNKDWELKFRNTVYKVIKARALWDMMVKSAWECADPGFINLDNIKDMNPTYYCEDIEACNPCGEIILPRYGSCCLGSINLSNMYNPITNNVHWTRLKDTITTAVRFLDNVLDTTYYPLEDIELVSKSSRRIGLGIMGLHYLLLKIGIKRYGSDESLEFMDNLFNHFRDYAYLASIELAKEKGAFQKFDVVKYMEGMFAKGLPRRVSSKLKQYGIRNGAILSMPPTGTTSLVAGVSSGIEPIFSPIHTRKYNTGKKDDKVVMKEKLDVDRLFLQFIKEGKDTSHFVGASDITPSEHMEVQATCQKYVDNSISKTINMKKDYSKEKLSELLLEHLPHIKGTTLYRESCKGMEVLTPVDHTKMKKEEIIAIAEKK